MGYSPGTKGSRAAPPVLLISIQVPWKHNQFSMEAQTQNSLEAFQVLDYVLQAQRFLPEKKFNSATLLSSLKVKFQCIHLFKMLLFNHDF